MPLHQPSPRLIQLTPPGRGAVATLRVEGPGAVAAVQKHFRARGGKPLAAFGVDQLRSVILAASGAKRSWSAEAATRLWIFIVTAG